jgi:hypothetical protein
MAFGLIAPINLNTTLHHKAAPQTLNSTAHSKSPPQKKPYKLFSTSYPLLGVEKSLNDAPPP